MPAVIVVAHDIGDGAIPVCAAGVALQDLSASDRLTWANEIFEFEDSDDG